MQPDDWRIQSVNTHRDDGGQRLDGAGAQRDVGEEVLVKARLPKNPTGVVPDLWKVIGI